MSNMSEEDKAFIKAEIAAARRMVQEDRILTKLNKHFPDEPPEPDPVKGPVPPRRRAEPNEPPPPKKSAWWGDALDS